MRGSWDPFTWFPGGLEREDPVAWTREGKRHEGSAEAMPALAFPSSRLCRVR